MAPDFWVFMTLKKLNLIINEYEFLREFRIFEREIKTD